MKKIILALAILANVVKAYAQDSTQFQPVIDSIPAKKEVVTGNGHLVLQVGIPSSGMRKAIKNEMGNVGFGGSLMVVSNPGSWGKNKRNTPFRIGIEAGYTYYGRFINDVEINGYEGDYKTSYGIINLNAVFQVRSPENKSGITPYASFLLGGNFYISTIKENLNLLESALGIEVDFENYGSASFNKGIALGFKINGKRNSAAGFGLHMSYNWGSNIKYIERNSLRYDNSTQKFEYTIGEAPVKYFLVQVGVAF